MAENKQHLFPNVVNVAGQSKVKIRDPKPNGGWGDIRDRKLCMSLVTGKAWTTNSNLSSISKS